jgi:hypothetical protein
MIESFDNENETLLNSYQKTMRASFYAGAIHTMEMLRQGQVEELIQNIISYWREADEHTIN